MGNSIVSDRARGQNIVRNDQGELINRVYGVLGYCWRQLIRMVKLFSEDMYISFLNCTSFTHRFYNIVLIGRLMLEIYILYVYAIINNFILE
jgi:hypothetical protein